MTVTVGSVNDDPVAGAGADQTMEHEDEISLSGRGDDADGDGLTFQWTQLSGPPAVIRDPDSPETIVDGVRGPATLELRLTVTDPSGASHTDDVVVTVNSK